MKVRCISDPAKIAVPSRDAQPVPMMRLFDRRDIAFLRAVPGYTARMEGEFRRRRCRVFREYLRSLRAELVSAQSELETLRIGPLDDYQPLALLVLRCRVRLACAMIPAYFCLLRYRWDLGSVNLRPVVQRFEGIRGEMRHWIPEIC
jgi:hypothetical protein